MKDQNESSDEQWNKIHERYEAANQALQQAIAAQREAADKLIAGLRQIDNMTDFHEILENAASEAKSRLLEQISKMDELDRIRGYTVDFERGIVSFVDPIPPPTLWWRIKRQFRRLFGLI